MYKIARVAFVILLCLLLIAIRGYGSKLFYDPFISYFRSDYLNLPMPDYDEGKLFLSIFLRYSLNTIVSLVIIYVAFLNKRLLLFSVKFYVAAFFVLSIVYYIMLKVGLDNGYLFAFYVRRFLIHPVFLLVLLPAFYYQKKLVNSDN